MVVGADGMIRQQAQNPKDVSGASGIVILKYPAGNSLTIGAGLTGSTTTVGSSKVTSFTAGTGTITFA